MSLVARVLEEGGISTVTFSNARDITANAFNPRTVFTNYPLGNPIGRPNDPENQRENMKTAFRLLETATRPGEIVDTPYVWSENREWMWLIFSDEQSFLTEEAEAHRRATLARSKSQKPELAG